MTTGIENGSLRKSLSKPELVCSRKTALGNSSSPHPTLEKHIFQPSENPPSHTNLVYILNKIFDFEKEGEYSEVVCDHGCVDNL
jgi:hypothetical protein